MPRADWSSWNEKATAAAMGTDLHSLIELLLATGEIERLAAVVRQSKDPDLERPSHYTTEPAAKKLERRCPDLAARLWRAQAMRIMCAKKSQYYDAALANFERAKRLYERAGLKPEWDRTVNEVRAAHHRKIGFMPCFEDLVSGSGPSDQPSFLDRAKTRWIRRDR